MWVDKQVFHTLYDNLTRVALNLVEPYDKGHGVAPSSHVWPYIREHLPPLKKVITLSLLVTFASACIEVWLIGYAGRLIDLLAETAPSEIWNAHRWNLLGAGFMLIALRPLVWFARHALNDIGIDCNVANLFRWRAHDHLTHQSVGWFQEDLAGRTASRLVQMGNYAAATIYHSLNAVAFGLVYMIGIIIFMASNDVRLAIPLFIWLALYITLMVWILPRLVLAMETFMAAKSALLGKLVDVFSNFDTVSLFARRQSIEADHLDALEHTRTKLFQARQIAIGMRTLTVWLEGVIIVGFVGYGIWFWSQGYASIGLVSAALALSLRITTMAEGVMQGVYVIVQQVGSVREALRTISQPLVIQESQDAPALIVRGGEIRVNDLQHHFNWMRFFPLQKALQIVDGTSKITSQHPSYGTAVMKMSKPFKASVINCQLTRIKHITGVLVKTALPAQPVPAPGPNIQCAHIKIGHHCECFAQQIQ